MSLRRLIRRELGGHMYANLVKAPKRHGRRRHADIATDIWMRAMLCSDGVNHSAIYCAVIGR